MSWKSVIRKKKKKRDEELDIFLHEDEANYDPELMVDPAAYLSLESVERAASRPDRNCGRKSSTCYACSIPCTLSHCQSRRRFDRRNHAFPDMLPRAEQA
jgi:hypothetical protein